MARQISVEYIGIFPTQETFNADKFWQIFENFKERNTREVEDETYLEIINKY